MKRMRGRCVCVKEGKSLPLEIFWFLLLKRFCEGPWILYSKRLAEMFVKESKGSFARSEVVIVVDGWVRDMMMSKIRKGGGRHILRGCLFGLGFCLCLLKVREPTTGLICVDAEETTKACCRCCWKKRESYGVENSFFYTRRAALVFGADHSAKGGVWLARSN